MFGGLAQSTFQGAQDLSIGAAGWGQSSWDQIEALNKALTAGAGIDPATFTSGRAMTYESLHSTLVQQLWTEQEAKLFRLLKSTPIGSTVHQWAERTSVGAPYGAFVAEGGNSVAHDQNLGRQHATVKYMQTHRQATLQSVITSDRNMTLEDSIGLETNAGALYLIQTIERSLFSANSMYNPLEFDGLEAQIRAFNSGANVIDGRTKPGTETFEDRIKEGSDIVRKNYGRLNCMFTDVDTLTGFQNIIRDRTRYGTGQPAGNNEKRDIAGNLIFNTYTTTHGNIDLYEDVFLASDGISPGPGTNPVASPLSGAPGAGAITAQVVTVLSSAPTGVIPLWKAGDAGDYRYQVVAVNGFGDGNAEAGSAAATIPATPANSVVRIACTVPTGAVRPTAIKLYRAEKDATTDFRYVKTVSVPVDTSTTVNIYDGNEDLPGTSKAYLLAMADGQDAIEWLQFAPMMRFNLYPGAAAVWPFLVLLYGVLALMKPGRHVLIKNIIPENLTPGLIRIGLLSTNRKMGNV